LNRIRIAGKKDDTWTSGEGELSHLNERLEALLKNWELEDGVLYYKNRLSIPLNKELIT